MGSRPYSNTEEEKKQQQIQKQQNMKTLITYEDK